MVVFKKSEFERDMNDVIQLCGTWWQDSLFFKRYKIPYKVHGDLFFRLKDADVLIYTCGRNEKGELVSCYVGARTPYMFNADVPTATEIVWCVRKENRDYKNLIGLTKAVEDLMEKEQILLWNLTISNEEKYQSTEKFLKRRGYFFMDRIYSKYRGV